MTIENTSVRPANRKGANMQFRSSKFGSSVLITVLLVALVAGHLVAAESLARKVAPKPVYESIPSGVQSDLIVFKLSESIPRPTLTANQFSAATPAIAPLNQVLAGSKVIHVTRRMKEVAPEVLDQMRAEASARSAKDLADLNRYFEVRLAEDATLTERLAIVNSLNELETVEIAYFAPRPELATAKEVQLTPNFQSGQYYLQAAPIGVNAYAAWQYPGGKGDNIKVVDIEGNWIETHEDLHGGTDDFHIAGDLINDPGWWNHGTAVLGEIAADSNGWGMTGIAFNVDLGTVSIGSMSTAEAITVATNNSVAGDVILIELHAPGPHYDFEARDDQLGYVAMEYWQDNFDAIQTASALGRIVVEAAGNGAENYDDTTIYGHIFDPNFRFSGAIMVGASSAQHVPASFTNYGQRVDVHGFGTWDVYSLGYGDLFGSSPSTYYTGTFAGTSSASPIIVGSCAVLQGIHKAVHGTTMNHAEMRYLLTTFSTPQASSPKHIGPLPNLAAGAAEVIGISFSADTTLGWVPLDVQFTGSSGLAVDTWTWAFGDGDSAFVQNPSHHYANRGLYDVTLQVNAGGDIRTSTKAGYIAVLDDSLTADTVAAQVGQIMEVTVSATNTIPLKELTIPVEYGGTLGINLAGAYWSTAGTRAAAFDYQQMTNVSPSNHRLTIRMANTGLSSDLPPGSGPILKLYFELEGTPSPGQDAPIVFDGYGSNLPEFVATRAQYQPRLGAGLVTFYDCCQGVRGNVDGSESELVDIADLLYLVNYMFNSGPIPPCIKEANINGDIFGSIDVSDLVYLVTYMFSQGPPPAVCY